MFSSNAGDAGNRYLVIRTDVNHPLSACSQYGFELDGFEWPSVEHYYQAMKFEEEELRDSIRSVGAGAQFTNSARNPARYAYSPI